MDHCSSEIGGAWNHIEGYLSVLEKEVEGINVPLDNPLTQTILVVVIIVGVIIVAVVCVGRACKLSLMV